MSLLLTEPGKIIHQPRRRAGYSTALQANTAAGRSPQRDFTAHSRTGLPRGGTKAASSTESSEHFKRWQAATTG